MVKKGQRIRPWGHRAMEPTPLFQAMPEKNILFSVPCDLVVIFCKPYSSKTEWHTDKVAIITDNFWHQEKYLQWPCWTVRLCDSTITDFCMNPQQKGESDSFPVYQFLRAAMAMSVKGRSVSRHTRTIARPCRWKESCCGKWSPRGTVDCPFGGNIQRGLRRGTTCLPSPFWSPFPLLPSLHSGFWNEWFWYLYQRETNNVWPPFMFDLEKHIPSLIWM